MKENRIEYLKNEIFLCEMADRMTDNERKHYEACKRELHELTTKFTYPEAVGFYKEVNLGIVTFVITPQHIRLVGEWVQITEEEYNSILKKAHEENFGNW